MVLGIRHSNREMLSVKKSKDAAAILKSTWPHRPTWSVQSNQTPAISYEHHLVVHI